MKKQMVNESKLGYEYISEVISSCEQNGIQCIVDDQSAEILFYDPKRGKFSTSKQLNNADTDIFSLLGGEDKDQYDSIMSNCSGTAFTDFATRWNSLQKKEDGDDVFKTKKCEMIRMDLKESGYLDTFKPIDSAFLDDDDPDFQYDDYAPYDDETCDPDEQYDVDILWKVTYKENGIRKGDVDFYEIPRSAVSSYDELVDYMVEKIAERHGLTFEHGTDWVFVNENYWKQEFSKVDESLDDDNRDWSANEDEVEIQWMIDDKDFGIVSGSTESFVIDLDLVDCFEELVYQVTKAMEEEYDGMPFDYDDDWIFTDEDKWLKRFGYNMN